MKLHKVTSSNIEAIGWNEGSLFIRFKNEDVYKYEEVPHLFFREMLEGSADEKFSVGKYFNEKIKRGGYKYSKLGEEFKEDEPTSTEIVQQVLQQLLDGGVAHLEQDEQGNQRVAVSGEVVKSLIGKITKKEPEYQVASTGVRGSGKVELK
jgi:KTSC domain